MSEQAYMGPRFGGDAAAHLDAHFHLQIGFNCRFPDTEVRRDFDADQRRLRLRLTAAEVVNRTSSDCQARAMNGRPEARRLE